MRVLIVEDDIALARGLAAGLSHNGFVADHCGDVDAALDWPDPADLAALIVDLGLPGTGGIELVRHWRRRFATPILILTARDNWEDKVEGLNAGADDFVVKPARIEEIVARLRAVMRRASGQHGALLRAGHISVDAAARQAFLDGDPVALTGTEYKLLLLFLHRAGRLLSQGEILDQLYPLDRERDPNTVEVYISRLRRKFGTDAIVLVRGLGYRLRQ